MEDILRAIALGVVQGLSEFLPISSSGHLIIVRDLFGWEFTDDLVFDVSLHIGTTVAVLAYFWRDWLEMARSGLRWLAGERERRISSGYDAHVLGLLVAGSVPIALVGFAFVLLAAERLSRGDREVRECGLGDALLIGSAQALALVPGVSRSGITISAGLARGLSRREAARFSFLLSTPAIGGAAALTFLDAAAEGVLADEAGVILAGAAVSAVVGWLSIAYLMRLVQSRSFAPFIVYRVVAGLFCIAYFAA